LVADDVAVGPIVAGIRMRTAVHAHDRAEALRARLVVEGKDLELVHALEVPRERAASAIDLNAVVVLAAGGDAARLEAGGGAVGQAGEEQQRVIDIHRALALAVRHAALLDERLLHADHVGELEAGEESAHVDEVGIEVAVRARAARLGAVAPEPWA